MMFHVRNEGEAIRQGFNFYPWHDRKYSIGVVFAIGRWAWMMRYAAHIRKFYWYGFNCPAEGLHSLKK